MKKFEYLVYKVELSFWTKDVDDSDLQANLNYLGSQGWEIVSSVEKTHYLVLFLKREIMSK
jgi:hypothetical protein